ncbi:bZIP transcription factor [Aspergillus tanneri]|uniref:BZIP domain-containing protein n=1 Tax=Aspergillus tanneri TaxID=1220188 RepID=A0A5M9N2K4_9EURO|nr:uncharacterized protein ATNIH1004_004672 [Aspergillus tanneri]KAA8648787.1 hypothetical protein ATNIH1004_004672 [Aspergillus tanneri]
MSGSRIERKRAIDRKAQQAVRERTKSRFAQLEQELEYYKQLNQKDNAGVYEELCQLREENKLLRQKLEAVKSIVSTDEAPSGASTISSCQRLSTSRNDPGSLTRNASLTRERGRDQPMLADTLKSSQFGFSLQDQPTLRETADIYGQIHGISPIRAAEVGNADISLIVKAINEGWHALGHSAYENPLVRILHDIDQSFFPHSSQVLRLAIMYKNFHLLKYFISPKAENRRRLPHWIQPRTPHPTTEDAVIEFFPWPFVRETLTQNFSRYGVDIGFAKDFQRCYRFYWPFPFQNAFTFDAESQTYRFNSLFENFCRDLRSWGIDSNFLELYPEFAGGFHSLASQELL